MPTTSTRMSEPRRLLRVDTAPAAAERETAGGERVDVRAAPGPEFGVAKPAGGPDRDDRGRC